MSKKFLFHVRVYYEDTDSGGVVYYANYLKFFERARSEMIYSFGLTNRELDAKYGSLIIVKSCNINYIKPAKFEDELLIETRISSVSKASFVVNQNIIKNEEIITEAKIKLVTVNSKGLPIKIPEVLLKNLIN